jgi:hypothetical protein
MQSCELQQWKLAVLCINDLKKQNNLIDKWAETYKPLHELEQNMQKSDVDAWAGAASGGSFRAVAPVAVSVV